MSCTRDNSELCSTCHRKVIVLMELDPNLVWSLGVSADMAFTAAPPTTDPNAPPPPAMTHLHFAFDDGASDPLNVPLKLDAFDPAIGKPPTKIIGVYAKAPVPDGVTPAWFVDPANGFPLVPLDVTVPDPTQPTKVVLSYSGPEIFDSRRYQLIEGHTP